MFQSPVSVPSSTFGVPSIPELWRNHDLLKIVPGEDGVLVVQWKEHLLETPVFMSHSKHNIKTAGVFGARQRMLGLRAGYATSPRQHDIRAEGLPG